MLKDINKDKIINEENLNNLFLSANLRDINTQCKILKSDFYLDSFNYFPITLNFETFHMLFKRQDDNSINHFYTKEFYNNLNDNKNKFKTIKNSFLLGSNPADNFFSNLIFFLPRIFFNNEKKIHLVIHRNLSNKFRNLIKFICELREIDVSFSFVDDGFYKFESCSIPQFLDINTSINVLKFFIDKILINISVKKFRPKIYIRRDNANYRKILNEADLIEKLRKQDFEIINPQHFEIIEQMKIFSNAELIMSPHGSNLSNIIFCKKGTKVIEISPDFTNDYEKNIANRYKNLSEIVNLNFKNIKTDVVDVPKHSDLAIKYINNKILNNSNYYKNMILKVSEIDELISNL